MTSIAEGLGNLIDRIAESDRRLARRTGEYIDSTLQTLKEEKERVVDDPAKALPPSTPSDFKALTDGDLKKLLRAYGVRGYTQRNGQKLLKKDRVALAVEMKIPALTYGLLLDFYMTQVRQPVS